MKTTVLLVDDHGIVRDGLRALIESQEEMEVLGECGNGREGVLMAEKLRPDVVLLDLMMPGLNGIEAMRQMMKENPSMKVLVLSSSRNKHDLKHAIEAGAAGYLIKETAADDLFRAIREVRRGHAFFSASISKTMQQMLRNKGCSSKEKDQFTPRETEVLQQVAAGQSNRMIADALGISIKTVAKHRQKLMDKTGIHEVAGLTRHAIENGLLDLVPADEGNETAV